MLFSSRLCSATDWCALLYHLQQHFNNSLSLAISMPLGFALFLLWRKFFQIQPFDISPRGNSSLCADFFVFSSFHYCPPWFLFSFYLCILSRLLVHLLHLCLSIQSNVSIDLNSTISPAFSSWIRFLSLRSDSSLLYVTDS